MRRDDRWREERDRRSWDFERDGRGMDGRPDYGPGDFGAYRYMDYRRSYGPRPGDRRGPEGSEDERAYRPFGDSGPTAYYSSEPGYRYGAADRSDPYRSDQPPQWRYQTCGDDWRDRHEAGPSERRPGEPRSFIDKAADEVATWFGDRDAGRRRRADEIRADSHRGRGPKDYRRSDDRIREDVNERLTDDPYLDATDIVVAVSGGEVTLSGAVATREDKRRAERLAEDVSGVSDVQNTIRLRPIEGPTPGAATPSAGNF
jgi:hypothetical protein